MKRETHKKVTVHDSFQDGYAYYLTEPIGQKFDPDFKPQLTPQQMLELGVFGGAYFDVDQDELPKEWFEKAKVSVVEDPALNYFKIKASQSRAVWESKGWIHKDDPRGWFQWYCRYYLGRRKPLEDERQIKRWKAISRHISQIKINCMKGDFTCRPRQRQAVLHWAYDSRKM